jgi:hypothetical protein
MQMTMQPTAARVVAPAAAGRPAPLAAAPRAHRRQQQRQQLHQGLRAPPVLASAAAAPAPAATASGGHTGLLHGLGKVGEVSASHMPWLLRLAHIKSRITGGDSNVALQESARGLLMWKVRGACCSGRWALAAAAVAHRSHHCAGQHSTATIHLLQSANPCPQLTPAQPVARSLTPAACCLPPVNPARRLPWSGGWCWTTTPSSS